MIGEGEAEFAQAFFTTWIAVWTLAVLGGFVVAGALTVLKGLIRPDD